MNTYGYPPIQWEQAKAEARHTMIAAAIRESTISYSALVKEIKAIIFTHHDFKLFHMLGQISTEEQQSERGLLTAVVVRMEDGLPGQGFFDLARELGLDSTDQDMFWVSELKSVYRAWGSMEGKEEE